ncbi:hypothetical protein KAFR_0C05920 [Kazachstania africana CBS 2517]|uniref:TRP C-terminal domain-containing protein n=1 Tax=Kazachstania africana (strain ATCC 22294 / BCRC 22015 / CBS 2517 / CECT 1963 / NBRC 1671 / NRRL Y-8276) TaxID=1071382 RepID=H2AT83_KAZAF|nr:hypothetical protein KAFR_0C05920 [Kazachstania africana CBS 2517]CCF57583.1 hypothetical protein KAFR_0C05920 [Kazachstania africana CBS 2517]
MNRSTTFLLCLLLLSTNCIANPHQNNGIRHIPEAERNLLPSTLNNDPLLKSGPVPQGSIFLQERSDTTDEESLYSRAKFALPLSGGSTYLKLSEAENPYLSGLLYENIFQSYKNECNPYLLSSGNITLVTRLNGTLNTSLSNQILRDPTLFIQCKNSSYSSLQTHRNVTHLLKKLVTNLSTTNYTDDMKFFLRKDDFNSGMIVILFCETSFCVGGWMLFLIIMLLSSDNYNKKIIIVRLYVLVYAVIQSVDLKYTNDHVLRLQYEKNFQDAILYEDRVVTATFSRVLNLIINILSNLNWLYISYFIYIKNNKVLNWKWLPSFMRTKVRAILTLATIISTFDNILLLTLICTHTTTVEHLYKAVECLTCVAFFVLVIYFIYDNFGFILSPKRIEGRSKISFKEKVRYSWRDYHHTIPVLVYNMLVCVSFLFVSIFLAARVSKRYGWKYDAVYFLKVLITVNLWGLIGILEKRELKLSKETILGKRINNKDEFFLNPSVDYNEKDYPQINQPVSCQDIEETSPGGDISLSHPLRGWKSRIERFRDRRKKHMLNSTERTRKSNPFSMARTQEGQSSKPVNGAWRSRSTNNENFASNCTRSSAVFDDDSSNICRNVNNGKGSGIHGSIISVTATMSSAETELARNYIYNHDNESSN